MDINSVKISDATFRVIDIETTGLDPAQDRVCEIAYRDIDAASGAEVGRESWLIDPEMPIPPRASAIHHLIDEDVAGAPKLNEVLPQITDSGVVYVAHNADFEKSFLGLPGRWLCTNRLALHAWPECESHSNQHLRYALGLSPDISRDEPIHRAGADVAVTAEILRAGLEHVRGRWSGVETVGQLIECVERPALLHRIPFRSSGFPLFEEASDEHLEWIVTRYAGGQDCVHTARYWLERRWRAAAL